MKTTRLMNPFTSKYGRWLPIILVLCAGFAGSGPKAAAAVSVLDLESGWVMDITEIMETITGLDQIDGITSLAAGNAGDDLMIVEGGGDVVVLDTHTWGILASISEIDLRRVFGLPDGDGTVSSLRLETAASDSLMYRDATYGDWYRLDLINGHAELFTLLPMPHTFYTGFSFTSPWDVGMIVCSAGGAWWYETLPDRQAIDLNLAEMVHITPTHVTEFEIAVSGRFWRFLIAVGAGGSPGTPTPTPGPGTPTATPTPGGTDYSVLVAHGGSSEDIWRIRSSDYGIEPGLALTGAAANQIVLHDGELYVINSLSHSITVYEAGSVAFRREMSTGIGKNPFLMDFVDNDHIYVTQFTANVVTRMNCRTGAIVTDIPMPDEFPADPGDTTWPRPMGIEVVGGIAYVACANLNDTYCAGGPGILVRIDTATNQVIGWTESGGRNAAGVIYDPRWSDWLWITNAGDYVTGSGFSENGTIALYSLTGGTIVDSIPVFDAPYEIAFGATTAYFSSAAEGRIGRLSLDGLSLLTSIALPTAGHGLNYVSGLAMGPDQRLWILEFNHDRLITLDTRTGDALVNDSTIGDGPDALVIVE
ncbi:hypothetical protein JXA80_11460 [bacterium]|nr:hypothetical protein [candidate division CSSED10-310 bacterium]